MLTRSLLTPTPFLDPSTHPRSLNNRVIAGMLLYQTRTNDTNCTDSKFNLIQQTCTGPRTNLPFGVDPIFRRGSSLYLPDFDDVNHTIVTRFYNCSQVGRERGETGDAERKEPPSIRGSGRGMGKEGMGFALHNPLLPLVTLSSILFPFHTPPPRSSPTPPMG